PSWCGGKAKDWNAGRSFSTSRTGSTELRRSWHCSASSGRHGLRHEPYSQKPSETGELMTQNLGCNHAVGRSIQVTAGGGELFTYVYRATDPQLESPRPYLHPIRTLEGDLVSVFRPHDHVWHKGITWSLPHFGHENFWGGPTFSKENG